MPIIASCPSCTGKFKAPDHAAGRKVKCPKCGSPIEVPPAYGPPAAMAETPHTARAAKHTSPGGRTEDEPHRRGRWAVIGIAGAAALAAVIIGGLWAAGLLSRREGSPQVVASSPDAVGSVQPAKADPGPEKPADPPMPEKGTPVTAKELLDAFKNEVAAERTYKGKVLDVTGTVAHSGDLLKGDSGWCLYLADAALSYWKIQLDHGDPSGTVMCFPAPGQRNNLFAAKGERVTVRGTCLGGSSVRLRLTNCYLVKSFKEERLAQEKEARKENARRAAAGPATKLKVGDSLTGLGDGKVLEVSGTVHHVTKEDVPLDGWASPTPPVKDELCVIIKKDNFSTDELKCFFRPKYADAVAKLRPGQAVTIRGILDHQEPLIGPGEGTAFLKFCTLAGGEDQPKRGSGKQGRSGD